MSRITSTLKQHRLRRPTLLLDADRVRANIRRMAERMQRAGVRFRPHFKTHQSAEIAGWFREAGTTAATVSSVDMATYFAAHGFDDLTVAFPVNLLEVEAMRELAARVRLNLLVQSAEVAARLDDALRAQVLMWIKVDAGYQRVGLPWDDPALLDVARTVQSGRHCLAGLLAHNGHTYGARSADEIRRIHREASTRLRQARDMVNAAGLGPCAISLGDTPSCSVVDEYDGIDEVRPGNFVFYDLMQSEIGACNDRDIAVAVACPVVSKHPERGQIAVYGGSVHFGSDSLERADGRRVYGYAARIEDGTWQERDARAPLVSLSQEHGLLQVEGSFQDEVDVGDVLLILPVHSCTTSNLYPEYRTLDGRRIARRRSNDELAAE